MSRPQLLMVDGLSLGLAPVVIDRLVDVLRTINGNRPLQMGLLAMVKLLEPQLARCAAGIHTE